MKMQILTINNKNFEKPSRNPPNRNKVKIVKKKNFLIAHQKIQFYSIQQTFYFFFLILDTYMFKSGTAANYLDIF